MAAIMKSATKMAVRTAQPKANSMMVWQVNKRASYN